jgi:hypothetical protein
VKINGTDYKWSRGPFKYVPYGVRKITHAAMGVPPPVKPQGTFLDNLRFLKPESSAATGTPTIIMAPSNTPLPVAPSSSSAATASKETAPTPLPTDPVAAFLASGEHSLLTVGPEQGTNARRHVRQLLEQQKTPFVYLEDMASFRDLQYDSKVDNGKPVDIPGPFRRLLETGGTLVVDLTRRDDSPGFTPQDLVTFYTLIDKQVWESKEIPCLKKNEKVRFIFLADEHVFEPGGISEALLNRVIVGDFSGHDFPKAPDLPIVPAKDHDAGTMIVDLHGGHAWRRRLFGGVEVDEDSRFIRSEGALKDFDFEAGSTLVLRNLPPDAELRDQAYVWNRPGKCKVILEDGLPEKQANLLAANKTPANDIGVLLRNPEAKVCTVNAANIKEVLDSHLGFEIDEPNKGMPVKRESLLHQMQARSENPIVYVTEDLSPYQWNRLLQHEVPFAIAAAPGVTAPANVPVKVPNADAPNASGSMKEMQAAKDKVCFVHSIDPTLIEKDIGPGDATRLQVTPHMRCDAFVYTFEKQESRTGKNAQDEPLRFLPKTLQLIEDLKAGKTVVLRGLDNDPLDPLPGRELPKLARELGTLLNPPHYLLVNGKRLSFAKDGELKGRLIVLCGDKRLLDAHPLSPRYTDERSTSLWRRDVVHRLVEELGVPKKVVDDNLPRLLKVFEMLAGLGAMEKRTPPANYATIKNLFRLVVIPASSMPRDAMDDVLARHLRSLFKDMLIGGRRRSETAADKSYAQLKACLKVVFPEWTSPMRDESLHRERLQGLLGRVNHKKDIERLSWQFLDAFSPDIIRKVYEKYPAAFTSGVRDGRFEADVLALVCASVREHKLRPPRWLRREVAQSRNAPPPFAPPPSRYERSPKVKALTRAKKIDGKIALVKAAGAGVFLQGPQGGGKSHWIGEIKDGHVYTAQVADDGKTSFADAVHAWAIDPEPATLVVDEANLATPGVYDLLRQVFADRQVYDVKDHCFRTLSENHHVIFTGNSNRLPGRKDHLVVRESFGVVQFKQMEQEALRKVFVEPLLRDAVRAGKVGETNAEFIANNVLSIHERLCRAFPALGLSGRNLKVYVEQVLCSLTGSSEPNLTQININLARAAMQVYAGGLPPNRRGVVRTWLARHCRIDAGRLSEPLYDEPAVKNALALAGLAPTPRTVEFAGGVSWWLDTLESSSRPALLIEGPHSRGKDDVVKAVLASHRKKQGEDFFHLNASLHDVDSLFGAIEKAYANGHVVLVSELNQIHADILEGRLNALLAGQSGIQGKPGFALIATVNPGYEGTAPMSAALKNRMQRMVLDGYAPNELTAIAKTLADGLRKKEKRLPGIREEQVEELLRLHLELLESMSGLPAKRQPAVRELRNAIRYLHRHPDAKVAKVFERFYAGCKKMAEASVAGTPTPLEKTSPAWIEQQLRAALALAHPEWLLMPDFRMDDSLPADAPVSYSERDHCLSFHSGRPIESLCDALLDLTRDGLPATLEDHEPVNLAPMTTGSGVGKIPLKGDFGTISFPGNDQIYLSDYRQTPDGVKIRFPEATYSNNAGAGSPSLGNALLDAVMLNQGEGTQAPRAPLLAPYGIRPANVSVEGITIDNVHRDAFGRWYVEVQGGTGSVRNVTYDLIAHPEPPDTRTTAQKMFPNLQASYAKRLGARMEALMREKDKADSETIVKELCAIFEASFEYSDEDAEALKKLERQPELYCMRFLEKGEGKCKESAITFAAILEQTFDIPARMCGGYLRHGDGRIPRAGHAWVEYLDKNGQWRTIDPTSFAPGSRTDMVSSQQPTASTSSSVVAPRPISSAATNPSPWSTSAIEKRDDGKLLPEGAITAGDLAYIAPDEVLELFSPAALGLEKSETRRGGVEYDTSSGELDVNRYARREARMFRQDALHAVKTLRGILIEDVFDFRLNPNLSASCMAWMVPPLAALHQSGVPIWVRNQHGDPVRISRLGDILNGYRRPEWQEHDESEDDGKIVVSGASGLEFLRNLDAHFYDALLDACGVDLDDEDAIVKCLLTNLPEDLIAKFPSEIYIADKALSFGQESWGLLIGEAEELLQRLDSLFDSQDADVKPTDDRETLRDAQTTICRIIDLLRRRPVSFCPEFTRCRDRLMQHIFDYWTRIPTLANQVTILWLAAESVNRFYTGPRVDNLRVISRLRVSPKPKTRDVEAAIAYANSELLLRKAISTDELEAVLAHIREYADDVSEPQRLVRMLYSLVMAMGNVVRGTSALERLALFRETCDAILRQQALFPPREREKFERLFARMAGMAEFGDAHRQWAEQWRRTFS